MMLLEATYSFLRAPFGLLGTSHFVPTTVALLQLDEILWDRLLKF